MDRVSLSPIVQSHFDRPLLSWWERVVGLVPPLRRGPAAAWWGMKQAAAGSWRGVLLTGRLLRRDLRSEDKAMLPAGRTAARATGQLLWLAPALATAAVVLAVLDARPGPVVVGDVPNLLPAHARQVQFAAADGATTQATWINAMDPAAAARGGVEALRQRRPLAVLLHDRGYDAQQMVPHVARLRAAGLHVLVLDVRNPRRGGAADVDAALAWASARRDVDAAAVVAWGVGGGASSVRDATRAGELALLVAEREQGEARFVPDGPLAWVRPLGRWASSLLYESDPPITHAMPRRVVEVERAAMAGDAIIEHFATEMAAR